MTNFWDYNIWSFLLLIAVLLFSMILAHILKRNLPFLKHSLIPASVLGGLIILIMTTIYKVITKESLFELAIFSIGDKNGNVMSGNTILETITYHCLAIGFIAMALRHNKKEKSKQRTKEIFNTGVTTVSTYLIQALIGLTLTLCLAPKMSGLIEASGIILALGYGQGTGQALNYGRIYENTYGFVGGANFGLTIAALGFLSASLGGVIYLNYLRRKNKLKLQNIDEAETLTLEQVQEKNEIPVNGSIDKFTIQLAIVVCIYAVSYFIMYGLGSIVGEGLKATIYGFNFLIGTLIAVLFKIILQGLQKKTIVKKEVIKQYWILVIIMGILGAIITFIYIRWVSKTLFPTYQYEQFFAMYGMLTGTASTGIILLREIDPNFETPASDNLVYQNLPAIIFGLPIMFLASYAPQSRMATWICFGIIAVLLILLLVILFREQLFKKKQKLKQHKENQ